MFKNETKNAMMAFAVVAMFMLSACAVVLSESDAAEYGADSFNIYMTTDDTFTYQPTANIAGTTFTVDGTATAEGAGSSYGTDTAANGGTALSYSFHPAAVADKVATITAAHSATGQSLTQTINFKVYAPLSITGSSSYSISANTPANSTIGAYTVAGLAATTGDLTISAVKKDNVAVQSYPFAISSGTLKTNAALTASDVGSYVITLQLTDTLGGSTNENTLTKTITMDVSVTIEEASDFSVTPSPVVTYVGDSRTASKTITINGTHLDSLTNAEFTISNVTTDISGKESNAKAVFGITGSDTTATVAVASPTLVLDTSAIANADIGDNADHMVIGYTVTLTGESNGVAITPVSHTYAVNFYKSLKFTTTPILGNANAFTSSTNGLDVIMSVNASGANKVTYNWGDGTITEKSIVAENTAMVTANHTYARAGTYLMTITACNDFEETSIITPYTTGASIIMDAEKTLKMTGIKETVDAEANTIVLDPTVIVTAGNTVAYKWTYSIDGAEAVELTAAGTPAWFKAFGGADHKSITISTAQADELPANVKFTCEASVTFAGDEKATTSSASYTYQDSHFMAQNGWVVWIAVAALVIGIVCIVFVTGPIMPVNIFTVIAAVLTVILFLAKTYLWF